MSRYGNSKKSRFLTNLPELLLESKDCDIRRRSKFNFSYFDESQEPGGKLTEMSKEDLRKLFQKMKEFTRETLKEWKTRRIGSGRNKVLEVYGNFPNNSDFFHPKHVPADVHWARFRLDQMTRLVGFVIPEGMCSSISRDNDYLFDSNSFYVVFLDLNHRFYKIS